MRERLRPAPRPIRTSILVLLLGAGAPPASARQDPGAPIPPPTPRYEVRVEKSVRIPMRDGVRLSTDLYVPVGAPEPLPAVLLRTPYDKNNAGGANGAARIFAGQGYVVAVQDLRGRWESEGEYTAWHGTERPDGYDTVEWLARRPWSNGRVGTYGCSYLGENQIKLAAERHPAHVAAIAQGAGAALGDAGLLAGGLIHYGIMELAASFGWDREAGSKVFWGPPAWLPDSTFARLAPLYRPGPVLPKISYAELLTSLPLVGMVDRSQGPPNDFDSWLTHAPGDDWWRFERLVTAADRIDLPVLHVNSWYDPVPGKTMDLFNLFREIGVSERARDNQFVIISPTAHCASERATAETVVGDRPLGDARLDYWDVYLDWFDHWLREDAPADYEAMPRLQLYTMGRNAWRAAERWPLEGTRFESFFLHSGGKANSRFGDGRLSREEPGDEPADAFAYDPMAPVPTVGGSICCTGDLRAPAGGIDQRELETRADVLVYTSEPLREGVEVTGPVEVVLYVSSDAKDTDFTAKLVDVAPDGTAWNVLEGIARVRWREGFARPVFMEAGEVYEVRIDLEATSNWFAPGHRIRLEVSSSSFPRWERNLNTGGSNWDETEGVVARNRVHHSARHPSRIVLPVVPAPRAAQ